METKATDVLLVQPPLVSDMRYGPLSKHGPNTMPFGLASIAAVLEQEGISVNIYDSMALSHTGAQAVEFIKKSGASIIGLSFMTPMYSVVKDLIQKVRAIRPNCFIVLGGAHPTILPEQTLKECSGVSCVVIGEADITFLELVRAVQKGKTWKNIQGIAFREEENVIINEPRPFIKDLDSLPLPAWHLLPMKAYHPTTSRFRKLPSHCLLTSRGCPMQCVFCSQTIGRQLRLKSVERVMQEMEILIDKYKAKELIIYDSCFTLNRKHVIGICDEMLRQKLNKKIAWSCETRVDFVDKDLLKLMRNAGCWGIHYGVESGSQRLLELLKKGITKEQVRQAFKWSHEVGLHTSAFFMLGLPTETEEDLRETFAFAREIRPDFAQFTITVPFPGTPLYDMALQSGYFRSNDWDGYSTWAGWAGKELIYVPEGRTSQEMVSIQKKAMLDFFLQPRILFESVIRVIRYPQLLKRYSHGFFTLLGTAARGRLWRWKSSRK